MAAISLLTGGWQAAIADLHADDPAALASASSLISLGPVLGGVLGPVVGSALAARDIRLPYAVSAVFAALACGLVLSVPETLPEAARKPFAWKQSGMTPLSFLVLFRNGAELATLTLIQLLSNLTMSSMMSFGELYRTELLGWDMALRGRYQSASMLLSLPGFALVGPMLRRCGSRMAVHLGLASRGATMVLTALASKSWHFFGIPAVGMFSMAASSALSAATTLSGARAGLAQGELQAALSNIRTLCQIAGPLLWGWIYAAGASRGRPATYSWVGAALVAVEWAATLAVPLPKRG